MQDYSNQSLCHYAQHGFSKCVWQMKIEGKTLRQMGIKSVAMVSHTHPKHCIGVRGGFVNLFIIRDGWAPVGAPEFRRKGGIQMQYHHLEGIVTQ